MVFCVSGQGHTVHLSSATTRAIPCLLTSHRAACECAYFELPQEHACLHYRACTSCMPQFARGTQRCAHICTAVVCAYLSRPCAFPAPCLNIRTRTVIPTRGFSTPPACVCMSWAQGLISAMLVAANNGNQGQVSESSFPFLGKTESLVTAHTSGDREVTRQAATYVLRCTQQNANTSSSTTGCTQTIRQPLSVHSFLFFLYALS